MPEDPGHAPRRVALLTQHGKERVLAPVLEPGWGCAIELVTGFDTDLLGTFTGETPRPGSQLDAARRKARKGMELSGLPTGLASEGSFGPDPFTGLFPWNVELLVWIDDTLGIEVVGMAQGADSGGHLQTGQWSEVEAFARREGFPRQQLVLRPAGPEHPGVLKGIADWGALREHFDQCQGQAANHQVFVEPDRRAFASPARLARIEEAARDLLQRLRSPCPACPARPAARPPPNTAPRSGPAAVAGTGTRWSEPTGKRPSRRSAGGATLDGVGRKSAACRDFRQIA